MMILPRNNMGIDMPLCSLRKETMTLIRLLNCQNYPRLERLHLLLNCRLMTIAACKMYIIKGRYSSYSSYSNSNRTFSKAIIWYEVYHHIETPPSSNP